MLTLFFCSIAQRVAASGAAPVLAIRDGAVSSAQALASEPLLFCLDNTTCDESAFRLVAELAELYHKSLHLLAVVRTLGTPSGRDHASRLFLPITTKEMLGLAYCAMSEYLARQIVLPFYYKRVIYAYPAKRCEENPSRRLRRRLDALELA
jgi:hypothetical protein